MVDDPEDILSDSLSTLYDYAPITHSSPGSDFTYTHPASGQTIVLRTPDTAPANWALHASSIWVAALFLADHIAELGLPDAPDSPDASDLTPRVVHVLELGAGAGLPSILLAATHPRVRVVSSDYPDASITQTLEANVTRNGVGARCSVVPYAWGADPAPLRGFDVVLAADTLWSPDLHVALVRTIAVALARTQDACAHLVAGLHTGRYTIAAFLRCVEAEDTELAVLGAEEREVGGGGRRAWDVRRAEGEEERERRRWVVWIRVGWATGAERAVCSCCRVSVARV
jgi:nicotinamide N-methyltransferase